MAVKNLLVVDFSYIMYPVIRLYLDRVDLNENTTVLWRYFDEQFGLNSNILKYDANAYKNIAKLIASNAGQNINTRFTMDIKTVCKELETSKDTYNITNIDYFDDLDVVDDMSDKFDDLNWISYLASKNKLEKYTWVYTSTSRLRTYDNDNISLTKFDKMTNEKWDQIIVTFSPHFVPYDYKTLFDVLEIVSENVKVTKKSKKNECTNIDK